MKYALVGEVAVPRNCHMKLSAFTSAGLGASHIILSAGTRTVAGMVEDQFVGGYIHFLMKIDMVFRGAAATSDKDADRSSGGSGGGGYWITLSV